MPKIETEKPLLRRPLLGLAAGFVLGVWLGLAQPAPVPWLLLVFALCLCLALACHFLAAKQPPARTEAWATSAAMALVACAFLAGWSSTVLKAHEPREQLLRNIMQKPREGVELIGTVADKPFARTFGAGKAKVWQFALETKQINRVGEWQPARGRVEVALKTTDMDFSPPSYGEVWRVFGVLTDASRYPTPEHGEQRPISAWIGAPANFHGQAEDAERIAEGYANPFMRIVHFLRAHGSRLLELGLEDRPEVVGLLQALLLGRRQDLSTRLREVFMATGTYHVFAISGQHVMLVAGFLIFLLQIRRFSRMRWFFFLTPALILYTVISGMSPSAMRGCAMALTFYAAPFFMRKSDSPSSLALAAILILAYDPVQLVSRGFILSFTAVAGLTVIYPEFAGRAARLLQRDVFMAEPEALPKRRLRRIGLYLIQLLCVSLAAWLATAPLCARWFHIFSIIGIIANLLVVPAIGLVLAIGFAAMALGAFAPVLAMLCNRLNLCVITLMVEAVSGMAKIPGGHVFVQAPPCWFITGWYISIVVWLLYRGKPRLWLIAPAALALLTFACLLWERNKVVIEAIYPSQRPVVLVKTPATNFRLFDTGPKFQTFKISRFLRERGVNRIEWVVFTRLTAAHAGAAAECLAGIEIDGIAAPSGGNMLSPTGQALEAFAKKRDIRPVVIDDGFGKIGTDRASWEALYPPAGMSARGDQAVMVLRFVCKDYIILIRGDANPKVEKCLMKQPGKLKADALILLDPEAAAACSLEFFKAVNPDLVVAAGLPRAQLASQPNMHVESLAPGRGVRLILHGKTRRVELFQLEQ